MSKRFKYEAPGAFQKLVLAMSSPFRWRSKARPWIIDNSKGVRFQLASDEDAKLSLLNERLSEVLQDPDPAATETAFDCVVQAIMARRLGYVSDWVRFADWQPGDWDSWIRSVAAKS